MVNSTKPRVDVYQIVTEKILELLADPQELAQTSRRLLEITKPLKQGNSAEATAKMLLQLANKN